MVQVPKSIASVTNASQSPKLSGTHSAATSLMSLKSASRAARSLASRGPSRFRTAASSVSHASAKRRTTVCDTHVSTRSQTHARAPHAEVDLSPATVLAPAPAPPAPASGTLRGTGLPAPAPPAPARGTTRATVLPAPVSTRAVCGNALPAPAPPASVRSMALLFALSMARTVTCCHLTRAAADKQRLNC